MVRRVEERVSTGESSAPYKDPEAKAGCKIPSTSLRRMQLKQGGSREEQPEIIDTISTKLIIFEKTDHWSLLCCSQNFGFYSGWTHVSANRTIITISLCVDKTTTGGKQIWAGAEARKSEVKLQSKEATAVTWGWSPDREVTEE